MTFKEQYLNGLCGLEMLEACTEEWHAMKVDSISLREYLGLTEQEYDAYLRTAPGVSFRELLDSQRKTQRFRVYQLDLEHGETRAFAFGGIDALHKAGFQQPPAAEYTLVYDGELTCPVGQDERDILERIFARYNQAFPPDYRGRSIAPSDVLELYDESERRYFYCDNSIASSSVRRLSSTSGVISVPFWIMPADCWITCWLTSKTASTILKVFVRIITATKVLNTHLKNIHVSTSDEYCQDGFSNGNVNTLRSSSSRVFSLGFVMVGRSFLLIGIEKGTVDFSAVPCGIFSFGVNYLSTNTSSPQMIDDTTFTTSSASICSATI